MGNTLNCLPLAECLDPPVFVLTAMLKIIELWPNPWAAGARRENMHGVFPLELGHIYYTCLSSLFKQ